MNRTCDSSAVFLAAVVSVPAQPPTAGAAPPVPLFSAEVIQSFTPSDNPITDAKAKLGDMIFDENVSRPTTPWPAIPATRRVTVSPPIRRTARGVGDRIGKRNAPSILNAMFYKSMFWDGRAATLEEQSTLPILNPVEMGQKEPKDVVAKLAAIPEFVEAFQKVFGRPPNWEDMGKALGRF